MSERKLLVTGASGKLGRQVVRYLLEDFAISPEQLIVTSRDASALSELVDKGVEVREADFADPDSLERAFAGADSLLLVSIDAIGQRSELHTNAVRAAEAAGVDHITYTSMPSADSSPIVFAYEHVASEKAIAQSTIANWMILRNNWYFENLPEFFASVLQTGAWLTASGQGRRAELSRSDLAYAAAAALVKSQPGKATLTMNGPQSLTSEEMAQAIDKVLGTTTKVVHLSDDGLKQKLESFQLPKGLVAMLTTMDQHNRDNYSDGSSAEFEQLTDKKPQSFAQWLDEHKRTLLAIAQGA